MNDVKNNSISPHLHANRLREVLPPYLPNAFNMNANVVTFRLSRAEFCRNTDDGEWGTFLNESSMKGTTRPIDILEERVKSTVEYILFAITFNYIDDIWYHKWDLQIKAAGDTPIVEQFKCSDKTKLYFIPEKLRDDVESPKSKRFTFKVTGSQLNYHIQDGYLSLPDEARVLINSYINDFGIDKDELSFRIDIINKHTAMWQLTRTEEFDFFCKHSSVMEVVGDNYCINFADLIVLLHEVV